MTIRVCSGWSPSGRVQYGNRFLESFHKHWPAEVELQVYVEEAHAMPRDACRLLWDIPGAKEFRAAYRDDPDANGKVPHRTWKEREVKRGYSFRHDAYKFWKQILIPGATAADMADGDILIWLDGDVVTTKPVPLGFVPKIMGDAEVCYLGRQPQHSEIGFYAIRLNAKTRAFLADMAASYTTGRFKELAETHSAYVWDRSREKFDMREKNLCKPGARGHVWPATVIAAYTRHDKGPRKGLVR